MNFFLDENFPKAATKFLEKYNHIVFDIRSSEFEGADDLDIFRMAQEKEAIFLTTDKDFYHTIPFQFSEHFGIVIFTLRHPNRDKILEKLKYFLDTFDIKDFKSKVVLFKDNHYSIY